jgi:hypothetical protein
MHLDVWLSVQLKDISKSPILCYHHDNDSSFNNIQIFEKSDMLVSDMYYLLGKLYCGGTTDRCCHIPCIKTPNLWVFLTFNVAIFSIFKSCCVWQLLDAILLHNIFGLNFSICSYFPDADLLALKSLQ